MECGGMKDSSVTLRASITGRNLVTRCPLDTVPTMGVSERRHFPRGKDEPV